MNLLRISSLSLAFLVGTVSLPLFCMETKPTIKIEKLYNEELSDEIFDFLCGGNVKNLSIIDVDKIEKLFQSAEESSLQQFIDIKAQKTEDKKTLFFSLCQAMSRYLRSTSSNLRKVFLRLKEHGIDPIQSEDPLSTFFSVLKNKDDFSTFFEDNEFSKYRALWNKLLIQERITFSIPKASPSNTNKKYKQEGDIEGIFTGDKKELVNAGGSITITNKKGTVIVTTEADTELIIEKIHPDSNITIKDEKFLERMKSTFNESNQSKEQASRFREVIESPKLQEKSLTKIIGDHLSIFAPLSIVGTAAILYCLAKMPGISIVATAGVFYLTSEYPAAIKRFYEELTRSKQDETKK